MKTKELLITTALLAAGLVGFGTGAIKTEPGMTRTTGCAIRLADTGPYLHVNKQHICNGVGSVTVTAAGDLKLTGLSGAPIVSMTCAADETLTQTGISCGLSGGSGTAVARFYSSKTGGPVRADSAEVTGPWANIWVTFTHGLL